MENQSPTRGSAAVLLAVCLASASMPLAFTGPTIALPAIAAALGGSPVSISWATNAYLLTFAQEGMWAKFWVLFGASNQLLAALMEAALLVGRLSPGPSADDRAIGKSINTRARGIRSLGS